MLTKNKVVQKFILCSLYRCETIEQRDEMTCQDSHKQEAMIELKLES